MGKMQIFSFVRFAGKSDEIDKLVKRLSDSGEYGVFSFENIIPIPSEITGYITGGIRGLTNVEKWCMKNWGTHADAWQSSIVDMCRSKDSDGNETLAVTYRVVTLFSFIPILQQIAKEFDVKIVCSWAEYKESVWEPAWFDGDDVEERDKPYLYRDGIYSAEITKNTVERTDKCLIVLPPKNKEV